MKKLIKRREIPGGNPVSDNTLLDRLYRSRHIKNSQELDRTFAINAKSQSIIRYSTSREFIG